jgi:hypothetical protein
MSRCGLQARSTVGACVCLGFRLRAHVPLRAFVFSAESAA